MEYKKICIGMEVLMNLLRTIGEHYTFGYLRSLLTPGYFFPTTYFVIFCNLLFNFINNSIKQ